MNQNMENESYKDVLSHYEENDTASETSKKSEDSWTEGEGESGFKALSLDNEVEDHKGADSVVNQENSIDDINELLPECNDSDGNDGNGAFPDEHESEQEHEQEHEHEYEHEHEHVNEQLNTNHNEEQEDLGSQIPELAHPNVDITRDPSISSRISSDMDIFSTRTPSSKQVLDYAEPIMNRNNGNTRTSTLTSTITSQFQPPNNMSQFISNTGYTQSIYSMDSHDDVVSEFSYMPNDDKPWEMGYNPPLPPLNNNMLSREKTNNTFVTSSGESIMRFESQLDKNRQDFSNDFESVMDQRSINTIGVDDNDGDGGAYDDDNSSVADNQTLKSDTTTTQDVGHDSSFNTTANSVSTSTSKRSIPTGSQTTLESKELKSVMVILDSKMPNSQKIQKLRDLRVEQSQYDTQLSNWLINQMELAKNTVSTTQSEFGTNIKTALNTEYTGGSPIVNNNIGLGYGLSAGLDSTKSKVADVGEGLQRGMQSLSRVARGHLFRRRDK